MGYIGNTPAEKFQTLDKQSFSVSATTGYTLSNAVTSPQEIALFINNVRQNPNSSYSVSGTALTLSAATASGDTMYCVFLGKSVGTIGVPAGGVGTSQIIDANITTSKIADSAVTSAKLASGLLPTNTPAFFVIKTSNQSVSATTSTLVTFDSEKFDSDNKFDTSTGKFTPGVAGKYFLCAQMNINNIHDQATTEFDIKQNSSYLNSRFKHVALNSSSDRDPSIFTSCIVDSDADDFFQIIAYTDFGAGTTITGSANGFTFFGGYKIIGA